MYMMLMIAGLLLVFVPQLWVNSTLKKYTQIPSSVGKTGAEVAREILNREGLTNVPVEMTNSGDHYDPRDRTVRLSPDFFNGRSIAAITVAAHECGHAIQHAQNYGFMKLRQVTAPAIKVCQLGPMLLFGSVILTGFLASPIWKLTAVIGLLLYTGIFFFQLITLPVELDASFVRAVPILEGSGYISPDEKEHANKILQACAFTYIAAALYSLMEIIRWAIILFGSNRR